MKNTYILFFILCLMLLGILSLSFGSTYISIMDSFTYLNQIIYQTGPENIHKDMIQYLRIPHIILAFFVGAGLALSGTIIQAVVKNPLADPYLLGISSGASFGAVSSIIIGIPTFLGIHGVSIFSFLGALSASAVILLLNSIIGKRGNLSLILSGFIVNSFCSAMVSLMIIMAADSRKTQSVQFWLMGNMSIDNMSTVFILAVLTSFITIFFIKQHRILDLMLVGDDLSLTMGYHLSAYRKWYIGIISILVGGIVYMTGIIGFIGLIIPHIVRKISGSGHKKLIPLSALTGGIFLVWTDVIGRSIIPGIEFPIGISTAIFGAPLFLWLLLLKPGRSSL